jgi:di/tricarboxylate transporter
MALVLGILVCAIVLFISERLRADVVALLVLASLLLTGLVTPTEAFSGFGNEAVVTIWAVYILSGGLSRTGIAGLIGRQIMRFAGEREVGLIVLLMIVTGVLSGLMNDVGVVALLLPVVMDISRRTGTAPSRMLIPLAFASLLGGFGTLIGTSSNLLLSSALRDYGLQPFQMFAFTPLGLIALLAGVALMAVAGRRLLPTRDLAREFMGRKQTDLNAVYNLQERLFAIRLPDDSAVAGKSLADSRLGAVLGVTVIGIERNGERHLAPTPDVVLESGDKLLVTGRPDRLAELQGQQHLLVEDSFAIQKLVSSDIDIAELTIDVHSPLVGQTLLQCRFRDRFAVNVLAISHESNLQRTNLHDSVLAPGDRLLVQGQRAQLEEMRASADFASFNHMSVADAAETYRLHERLIAFRVPQKSLLVGRTLTESQLGDAFGLTVLGIVRGDTTHLIPKPDHLLHAGDILLVTVRLEDLSTLRGLQDLEIDDKAQVDFPDLESEDVGMAEVILSPHTTLTGNTLRQLYFRERHDLSVLAIWRGGRSYRSNLRNLSLRLGDALLVHGSRDKLRLLSSDPNFLMLTEKAQEAPRLNKAPLAALVMVSVLVPVIFGWLPISVAAIAGATLMILAGCLTMTEAYRFIEWQAVFLIAGMLPLGIAMQQTGTAQFLAQGVVALVANLGPLAVVAAFFVLGTLASQFMPNPAVAVLLAPIVLNASENLRISPHALMMTLALAVSTAFLTPVAHPVNVLIMGPGGYRFADYVKVGLPFTLLMLLIALLVLPLFWPLSVAL